MAGPNTPSDPPPPFVVEPTSGQHTHSLILLHGLGSNGEKFGRELLETGIASDGSTLPQLLPGARFVFPTSRRRRSTAFGRSVLTMWFDIMRLSDPSFRKDLQLKGLAESAGEVLGLLRQEQEVSKIPPGNIILGGISQGCATSLSVLLALDYPLGGFVGISGYLPFLDDIAEEAAAGEAGEEQDDDDPFARSDDEGQEHYHDPATRVAIFERDLLGLPPVEKPSLESTAHSTPIFLGHGSADEKVPCSLGEAMSATIGKAGYQPQFKAYQGLGHWYKIPDEIDDIVGFIRSLAGWEAASGSRD